MRPLAAFVFLACFASLAATAMAQVGTRESLDLCVNKVSDNGNFTIMKAVPQNVSQPEDGQTNLQGQYFLLGTQEGRIYLYNLTTQTGSSGEETFLLDQIGVLVDMRDLVKTGAEANQGGGQGQVNEDTFMGLMNFAFHPNFSENGLFYTFFTCDQNNVPECNVQTCDENCPSQLCNTQTNRCEYNHVETVVEWFVQLNQTALDNPDNLQAGDVIASANLSRVVLVIPLREATHHGGALTFDNTSRLIVGVGDGTAQVNQTDNTLQQSLAQNLSSIYGKINRLGVFNSAAEGNATNEQPYIVPDDNPFVNRNDADALIWAYGFRNPWRCSIDAVNTSRLICVDSALNQTQEVNIIERGGNYGWPILVGNFSNPSFDSNEELNATDLIAPFAWYNETSEDLDGTFSTGAVVYRGNASQCHFGMMVLTDLFGAVFVTNFTESTDEQQPQQGSANLTKIDLVCAKTSALPCDQNDPNNPNPVILAPHRLWGLGQGERGQLFVLSDSGVWMATSQENCDLQCPAGSGGDNPDLPANGF